jgi:phosphate:Na+ symporter
MIELLPIKGLFFKLLFGGFLFLFFSTALHAGNGNPAKISWGYMTMGLFGGLALFLYGLEKTSEGLKKSTGSKMRSILEALTKNRVIAFLVGALVTMVIQSSSATTVMLVSFVQAELMSFAQSLGVILGADIGTTITAQLIAFKLTDYALVLIVTGFLVRMLGKTKEVKHIGEAILGFGLLFFGMKLMSDAMAPLRSHAGFIGFMEGLENPLAGLLAGTVLTALMQSSSAFIGIVIVLAQQQLITLEAGIPLIFGANIGTCITAGFASIGMSRDAKRVALANVLFKVAGVLLFIFWIPFFADMIRSLNLKFDIGPARQIANAHTIFNLSLGLVFLPFTALFARYILKILPDKAVEKGVRPATWFLDDSMISTPEFSIDLVRTEISRMAKILERMLRAVIVPLTTTDRKQDEIYPQLSLMEGIDMRENKIDFLELKIRDYLLKIGRQELSQEQANEVIGMMSIAKDMEGIGDIVHKSMAPLIAKKQQLNIDFSEEGQTELLTYNKKAIKQIRRLKKAFAKTDPKKIKKVIAKEEKYLDLDSQYREGHMKRLFDEREESIETHAIHMELMDLMKQVNVYAAEIAKTIPVAGW